MQFSTRIIVHLKGCSIHHIPSFSTHGTYNWRPTSYLPGRLSRWGHDYHCGLDHDRSGHPVVVLGSRKRGSDTRVGGDTHDDFRTGFSRISYVSILQMFPEGCGSLCKSGWLRRNFRLQQMINIDRCVRVVVNPYSTMRTDAWAENFDKGGLGGFVWNSKQKLMLFKKLWFSSSKQDKGFPALTLQLSKNVEEMSEI